MVIRVRSFEPGKRPVAARPLLDCHDRIRDFADAGVRLLTAGDAPPGEVAAAARAVHRYFTVGLAQHVLDEDLSVAPRLRALGLAPPAREALERMVADHPKIEALLATLAPAWLALAEAPGRLEELRPGLEPARELRRVLEEHLSLEEREVLPLLDRLPAAELDALVSEMRERRRSVQPWT